MLRLVEDTITVQEDDGTVQICVNVSGITGTVATPFTVSLTLGAAGDTGKNVSGSFKLNV